MQTIFSIVPRLPPTIDGVGDYADLLSKSLVDRYGIATKFIACDPQQPVVDSPDRRIEFGRIDLSPIQLPKRSSTSLLTILDLYPQIDTLLLQYVGYGYANRGCPLWLVAALKKWCFDRSDRRLAIVFHEVYATASRPWNSQFWTSPLQQQIAKDLIDLSDGLITSNQLFAGVINKLSSKHQGKIDVVPIFSNIGELSQPLPLNERQPWLVTFGNAALRKSIYTNSLSQLTTVCQQLGIKEIYDIGHSSPEVIRSIPQIKINIMGTLPASEISQIFSMARAGFINYPLPYIAKSGIFAAYSSHQLLSVFDRDNLGENLDGVNLGRHYWSVQNPEDKIDLDLAQTIASNAYQWYDRHNLSIVADRVADLLSRVRTRSSDRADR